MNKETEQTWILVLFAIFILLLIMHHIPEPTYQMQMDIDDLIFFDESLSAEEVNRLFLDYESENYYESVFIKSAEWYHIGCYGGLYINGERAIGLIPIEEFKFEKYETFERYKMEEK